LLIGAVDLVALQRGGPGFIVFDRHVAAARQIDRDRPRLGRRRDGDRDPVAPAVGRPGSALTAYVVAVVEDGLVVVHRTGPGHAHQRVVVGLLLERNDRDRHA